MRNQAPGEYYHVYNRGMQKQPIFESDGDRIRLLFLLLTFQGESKIKNINREVKQGVQNRILHIDEELVNEVVKERLVELVSFCLMPNHFHLILKEVADGGISKYMQRVLIAYTKFFNTKYEKSGHLFQGPYKSVHIGTDEQLTHLSAYIHKNPIELPGWRGRLDQYTWSSYGDCLHENRFDKLLSPGIIVDRFEGDLSKYKKFVDTNPAKEGHKF